MTDYVDRKSHAVGPWIIETERSPDGSSAYITSPDHGALATVVVKMEDDDTERPCLLANAKLIAAAPSLLDALRKIIAEPLKAELSDGAIIANMVEIATTAERRVTQ